jgi:hypothetical protein
MGWELLCGSASEAPHPPDLQRIASARFHGEFLLVSNCGGLYLRFDRMYDLVLQGSFDLELF